MNEIYNKLIKIIPQDRIMQDEPMSRHTSIRIGGKADIFVIVETVDELKKTLELARENNTQVTCIGNGTNVLVKDNGIRGIVIKLDLKNIEIKNEEIIAESGVPIPLLSRIAYENGLSGLEFASGIPGTIGGAITMNAGAYGGEFKDIVEETTYMDKNFKTHTIKSEEHEFTYRHSIFSENDYIIISTVLKLKSDSKETIKNKMDENLSKRIEKQPLDYPNAGSIFKRKSEIIPSELIDKCGLKGYNIGDAYVSEKHAGFIVNKGNATAEDVISLIEKIQEKIKKEYNTELELELKIIGE